MASQEELGCGKTHRHGIKRRKREAGTSSALRL